MKTELVIAPDLKEPEVIIRAAAMTPALEALAEELRLRQIGGITAVRDGEAFFSHARKSFDFLHREREFSARRQRGCSLSVSGCTSWRSIWPEPGLCVCHTRRSSIWIG